MNPEARLNLRSAQLAKLLKLDSARVIEELRLRHRLAVRSDCDAARSDAAWRANERPPVAGLNLPQFNSEIDSESDDELTNALAGSDLSGVSDSELIAVQQLRRLSALGEDNRIDLFVLERRREQLLALGGSTEKLDRQLGNARAVGCWVHAVQLPEVPGQNRVFAVTQVYGQNPPVCASERFYGQPRIGTGTVFFVGNRAGGALVVTAGHNVLLPGGASRPDLDQWRVLFDFCLPSNGALPSPYLLDNTAVYAPQEVVAGELEARGDGADWALVRLDRAISPGERSPVRWRAAGSIQPGDGVYMLGHPSGLTLKLADQAHVLDATPATHFLADLDAFEGNSGSPVFNAATDEVEGILVRGGRAFERLINGDTQCLSTVFTGSEQYPGEQVALISLVTPVLES